LIDKNGKPVKRKRYSKKTTPITEQVIQEIGSRYLQRYVPSISQYRRVLIRNIDKRLRELGTGNREEALRMVEEDIQRRVECGALHDERFANTWTEHLYEKGKSLPQIKNALYTKGISRENIENAIKKLQEGEDPVFFAAVTYARKRRFGPFRLNQEDRISRKQKDMASMLRVGHPYDVVKEVLECSSIVELDKKIQAKYDDIN
jgi:regulatory protein